MSTVATIEEEVSQIQRDEIQAFTMPKPHHGQQVTWYPDAKKRNGEMAFALEVGRRNIIIQRVSGTCMETVYHIDDPKLAMSQDIRDQGAWDFTEDYYRRVKDNDRMTAIEARIATLEALLADEPKKGSK